MPDTEYCAGYVDTRTPAAVVEYSGRARSPLPPCARDGREFADLTMVVHTPGGAWRCSDDFNGLAPAIGIEQAAAGRYDVWVGTYGAGRGPHRRRADALGDDARRAGVALRPGDGAHALRRGHVHAAGPRRPPGRPPSRRRRRRLGQHDVVPAGANPVSGPVCSGFIAAGPTASVEMSGAGPLGITAMADDGSDLVLVVRTPDNRWFCSDDADGLNPGVQIGSADDPTAAAGTYLVWVGTFGDPNGWRAWTGTAHGHAARWDRRRSP